MNDSATEFHDVSLRRGNVVALENVSLKLRMGQTTAILGEGGRGKSTLVQLIIGLLRPDSGTVKTLGADIDYDKPRPLRKRIGYAIQDVALFPHLRIRDNIVLPGRLSGWSEPDRTSRLQELLDLMQLPEDVLGRYPHELSGGHPRNPDRAVLQQHGASAGRPALAEQRSAALDCQSLSLIARIFGLMVRGLGLLRFKAQQEVIHAADVVCRVVELGSFGKQRVIENNF